MPPLERQPLRGGVRPQTATSSIMSLPAIRTPSDLPMKKKLRCYAGRLLAGIMPRRAREVRSNLFDPALGPLDKLVRNGLFHRALVGGDHALLKEFLADYWASAEGKSFHDDFRFRFQSHFLDHAVRATDDFATHLAESGAAIDSIYEVGCGTGQVLEYLQGRFPGMRQFVGIDLSEEQTVENRRVFEAKPELQFVAADACDWIPAHAQPGCVVLTNGGVFEYLDQAQLAALFSHIADRLAPASVVVVETVANDHDLDAELGSLVYGREMSFSHNYPHLLATAGFDVCYREERIADDGCRWIYLHAATRPGVEEAPTPRHR